MKTNATQTLTAREHTLIGKALFTAARALRAQSHPPEADIAGMNDLLDRYYPTQKQTYEAQCDLQLALRAGYKPQPGPQRNGDVKRWLDANLLGNKRDVIDIRNAWSKPHANEDDD